MKHWLKRLLRQILGDYEIFRIYCLGAPIERAGGPVEMVEINADLCRQSPYSEIRALARYDAADARGFGLLDKGELVCACWYWCGEHYARNRGYWPLEDKEAKLVQLTTAESARGKAFARRLIAGSSRAMMDAGFSRLFARIWFGHRESERPFEAAGWKRIATVMTIEPPLCNRSLRLQWPMR